MNPEVAAQKHGLEQLTYSNLRHIVSPNLGKNLLNFKLHVEDYPTTK